MVVDSDSSSSSSSSSKNNMVVVEIEEGRRTQTQCCNTNINNNNKNNKMKSGVVECRICQEEDDVLAMETPCACNGTLKFAHRKCIQRWCNKKGDINCEICSQVFSPNYSLPPARITPDILAIDMRQSWGPHISLHESHLIALATAEHQLLQSNYEDYTVENSSSITCLRYVALILLMILLVRQALMLIQEIGAVHESSKFFNFQVSVLQLAGFLLPCFVMARTWYIQNRRRQV